MPFDIQGDADRIFEKVWPDWEAPMPEEVKARFTIASRAHGSIPSELLARAAQLHTEALRQITEHDPGTWVVTDIQLMDMPWTPPTRIWLVMVMDRNRLISTNIVFVEEDTGDGGAPVLAEAI